MVIDRTKRLIANTMKELMKRKSVEQIRVTEICELAEIERSTLYYHFRDKYDIIAWFFMHHSSDMDILDPVSAARNMDIMKEELHFYRKAFQDSSQNALWNYLFDYYLEEYSVIAKERLNTPTLDLETRFSIRMYCYGAISMCKDWILLDTNISSDELIRLMFLSMPQNLRKIYFINH